MTVADHAVLTAPAEVRPALQNAFHLAVASVLRKSLVLAYFVIVARYAGLNVTGLFYLVICYGALFSAVVDFGLTPTFIRDASREPGRIQTLLAQTLSLKLIAAVVALAGVVGLLELLWYPPITNHLIYIVVVTVVLESFGTALFGSYRVYRDMRPEAVGMVVGGAAALALVAIAVAFELSPYFLILAISVDSAVNLVLALMLVRGRLGLRVSPGWPPSGGWDRLRVGIPFALSALFVQVYAFDAVVLQKIMGEHFVALYSVAARSVGSLRFVPVMLGVALFPVFSRLFVSDPRAVAGALLRHQYAMLAVSAPLAVLAVGGADALILLVFGDSYAASIWPFRIMAAGLVPVFVTAPTLALLNAGNAQTAAARNVALAIAAHAVLSLGLIPRFGVMGAAFASTASSLTLAILNRLSVGREIGIGLTTDAGQVLRVGVACAAMAVGLLAGRGRFSFWVAVGPAVLTYLAAMFVVEGVRAGRFEMALARARLRSLLQMLAGLLLPPRRSGEATRLPTAPGGSQMRDGDR